MIKLWNEANSFLPIVVLRDATRYCSHAKSRDVLLASPSTTARIFSYFLVYNEGGARHVAALHPEKSSCIPSPHHTKTSPSQTKAIQSISRSILFSQSWEFASSISSICRCGLSIERVWKMARLCIYLPFFFLSFQTFLDSLIMLKVNK